MSRLPENIFDNNGLSPRDPGTDAIYQASRMRDEQEVIRLLDAHRAQYGEPEQIAYANRAESRQDDPELGQFPFAVGGLSPLLEALEASNLSVASWSPSIADAEALSPAVKRGELSQVDNVLKECARRI